MTEMDAMDEMAAMAAQFADAALPFSDPEGAAARATAEPMAMYTARRRGARSNDSRTTSWCCCGWPTSST